MRQKPITIDAVIREVKFPRGKSFYRYGTLNVQSKVLTPWVGRRVHVTIKPQIHNNQVTRCSRTGCGKELGIQRKWFDEDLRDGWYCSNRCLKLHWRKDPAGARKFLPSGKKTLKKARHPTSKSKLPKPELPTKELRTRKKNYGIRTPNSHRRHGRRLHRPRGE